jgi:photosystem II stability/assembly factor-like uncharacterized protein
MIPKLAACVALCSFPLGAAWEAIGPFGGPATVVQFDRQHRGAVLAATSNAQLFRSDDDGASWRALSFPPELRATLHAFIVDPHQAGRFLVGLSSSTVEYSGLFRTEDGGRTWEHDGSAALKDVWSIAIWDRDPRVIAAGTVEGVFLTADGGKHWRHLESPDGPAPKPVVSLAFDPLDSKILYAGTPHLPWKTVDGGATWQSVHEGMLDDSDVFSILIDSRHRQTLLAGVCGGIFRSLDGGQTWTKSKQSTTGVPDRTYQIVQHPLRPSVLLAATALGLIKSVDSGATWRRLSTQSTRSIAFDPVRPERIFLATDNAGLFVSDNLGDTVRPADLGFSNRRFSNLTTSENSLFVSLYDLTGTSVLRRTDTKYAWEVLAPDQAAQVDPANVAALSQGTTGPAASLESRLLNLLVTTHDCNRPFVDTQDGIYRTDDAGVTWNLVDFHTRSLGQSRIYTVLATEDRVFLAATSEGLMRSIDKGVSWSHLAGVLGGSTVTAISRHPTKAGVLFASQFGVVFSSADYGRSWIQMRERPGGGTVLALRVAPGNPDRLFALTETRGVYSMPLDADSPSRP